MRVTVPRAFVPTHQTAGLPGFPAVDLFAKPGTDTVLGFSAVVTRVSGHDPAEMPPQGVGGPWGLSCYVLSDRGDVYYLTHFVRVARPGTRIPAGGRVGIIGDYPGLAGDHVHVGHHKGDSPEAHYQSTAFPGDCYLSAATPPPPRAKDGPPPGGWKLVGPWLRGFLKRGHWKHP